MWRCTQIFFSRFGEDPNDFLVSQEEIKALHETHFWLLSKGVLNHSLTQLTHSLIHSLTELTHSLPQLTHSLLNPELQTLNQEEIKALHETQFSLLSKGALLLRPGGSLVYRYFYLCLYLFGLTNTVSAFTVV